MEAYRDQYATLFRGGLGVTVIAISTDSIEELQSWAQDAHFPQLFASDPAGESFRAFGVGVRDSGVVGHRMVAVIDPEGRVSFVASPFREIDPTAYEELAGAVSAVAPDLAEEEGEGGEASSGVLDSLFFPGDC